MSVDDELDIETNSDLDQHFLINPAKLALLIAAADIQPTDHVVEVGAGIGTVAEHVPVCRSLTVIEYDSGLIPHLRNRLPHARAIQGDAFAVLPTVRLDVLVSNLPSTLTPALVELLPRLDFRVALVTVPSIDSLAPLKDSFTLEEIAVLEPDDFWPRQAVRAEIYRCVRDSGGEDAASATAPHLTTGPARVRFRPGR
ncbi:MAG: rRNA adenine N-6-methyltransferase family protein [Pseudonocardiaceae bacterium]